MSEFRRFVVVRSEDVTGVSGTGLVAEGVQFTGGACTVRWCELAEDNPNYIRGVRSTTTDHKNIESVQALHGHNGATVVVWLDE